MSGTGTITGTLTGTGTITVALDLFYVIFHKRVRVFYQGLQTREDNENHEGAARVIFIVLECL